MIHTFLVVLTINALFFLAYGFQALNSKRMAAEFLRFGMNDAQRKLTAWLQIAGALGLFAGTQFPIIGILSSTGLSVMMLVAFFVRLKIKDGIIQSSPSLIFMIINAWLSICFISFL